MSHLRLANVDFTPVKYIMKCLSTNYPDALGLVMIHNAPYGAKSMPFFLSHFFLFPFTSTILTYLFLPLALWKLISFMFPKEFASRVKFTRGKKGLQRHIAPEHIMKEYGGDEDWKYEYEEPTETENLHMQDAITRDRIIAERRILAMRFEELTNEWIMTAQGSDQEKSTRAKRDAAAEELIANFWQLDPYVRARSLYERQGCFRGAEGVDWHPPTAEEGSIGDDVLEKIPVASVTTAGEDTLPTGAMSSGVSVYSNV